MAAEKTILMVGATGNLGSLIARQLMEQANTRIRVLVRPASRDKTASYAGSVDVIEGDLNAEHASLVGACEGVSAIVSAVQGGPDVIIDGQGNLLRAAREAGVSRFIPSDYSADVFGQRQDGNMTAEWRRSFAEQAAEARGDVQVVHVLSGCFLDLRIAFGFLGAFDLQRGSMALWGDGHAPMDFTTYADTARYAALAATRDDMPAMVQVAGDTLDFWQLKAAVEEGTGRSFEVVRHGALEDLDAEIARRQQAEPTNMFAWLPMMYWRGMLSGKGRLKALVNDLFPEVAPTTVAAYARAHRAALGGETEREGEEDS